jgi:hypothetical protein
MTRTKLPYTPLTIALVATYILVALALILVKYTAMGPFLRFFLTIYTYSAPVASILCILAIPIGLVIKQRTIRACILAGAVGVLFGAGAVLTPLSLGGLYVVGFILLLIGAESVWRLMKHKP